MANTQSESLSSIVKKQLTGNVKQYSMFLILIAVWIIFTIATGGLFLTPRNISNLFSQTTYTGIIACGMVLIIVAGHIDLSVGSVVGLTGAIAAIMQVKYGMPTLVAASCALLVGILIGAWQGFWVAKIEIPAFIVSLSTMVVIRGILVYVTQGATIGPLQEDFRLIGQGYVPPGALIQFGDTGHFKHINLSTLIITLLFILVYAYLELTGRKKKIEYGLSVEPMNFYLLKIAVVSLVILFFFSFLIFGRGMPYSVLIVTLITLVYSFMSKNTRFGRYVYAIGGNKEAARLSGIDIVKVNFLIFVSIGFLSGLAGVVFAGLMNSASASAGTAFELDAISAAIIGGTSTLGGVGTITGAIVGALLMSSLNNGMQLLNLGADVQMILRGLILIAAVYLDFKTKKR